MTAYELATELMSLYEIYSPDHRPFGHEYIEIVMLAANNMRKTVEKADFDDLAKAVEIMTDENYHTAVDAIKTITNVYYLPELIDREKKMCKQYGVAY